MIDRFIVEFWSKDKKRFISLDSQGLYVNFSNGHIYTCDESMNVSDRYIRRQCTGLRDKNGTLIFEGDIAKVNGTKSVGVYITTVIHSRQGYTLKQNHTYLKNDTCLVGIEIIGNIYENPELLERKE